MVAYVIFIKDRAKIRKVESPCIDGMIPGRPTQLDGHGLGGVRTANRQRDRGAGSSKSTGSLDTDT